MVIAVNVAIVEVCLHPAVRSSGPVAAVRSCPHEGTFFTEPKRVRHFGVMKDEGAIPYFVGAGPSTNDDPEIAPV
jgi:hypothetical protein